MTVTTIANERQELLTELSFSALLHKDEAANYHLVDFIIGYANKRELQAKVQGVLEGAACQSEADVNGVLDQLKQELEKLKENK